MKTSSTTQNETKPGQQWSWLSRMVRYLSLRSAKRNMECARVNVDFFDNIDRLQCLLDDVEELIESNTD